MKKLKKIAIIYDAIYDPFGKERSVGGIQTYLLALARGMSSAGYEVTVVQDSAVDFKRVLDEVVIIGVPTKCKGSNNCYKKLLEFVKTSFNPHETLLIWGSFYFVPKQNKFTSISIQHGISFDLINESARNNWLVKLGFSRLIKAIQCWQAESRYKKSQYRVCVDYNFLNWYRTRSSRDDDDMQWVIPNFTDIPEWEHSDKYEFKNILFARRFVDKRGVGLMVSASKKLMDKYPDVTVTFAGEGPRLSLIEDLQRDYPGRIVITKYKPQESLVFHKKFDISVVPTLGSEGTSLSLLEAMAAGCAVVCTNVGGMTNIVIDEYNGFMVNPNADEIFDAIDKLIVDVSMANKIRYRARKTVQFGFSKLQWERRWMDIIDRAWEKK
jgi:glycosyltransferase involved in cell wall biosynthesis